jgi:hypothetical protein
VRSAWTDSYSPAATKRAIESIEPVPYKISHLIARLCFRGIYFPPKGAWGWLKVIAANRSPVFQLVKELFTNRSAVTDERADLESAAELLPAPAELMRPDVTPD